MGARNAIAAAAGTLVLASGCGSSLASMVEDSTTPPPSPTRSAEPQFADADPGLRTLAVTFVSGALGYDTRREGRQDFLVRVADISTQQELRRLRRSPRAEFNWAALKARHERTRIEVTGVTRVASEASTRLDVHLIRTTITDYATLRTFEQVTLEVVETHPGLRVAAASGAGL